eukprot:scaffold96148_cov32-Tisochrysis_lutea.AAC.6
MRIRMVRQKASAIVDRGMAGEWYESTRRPTKIDHYFLTSLPAHSVWYNLLLIGDGDARTF